MQSDEIAQVKLAEQKEAVFSGNRDGQNRVVNRGTRLESRNGAI